MRVGKHVLPKNSLLIGEGRIQGERLHVNILQVEYGGTIIPVKLAVYDNDGQEGIFIPGSMEANAVKEVAANLGQNLGTSISITNQSAGDQLLSELGRVPYRVSRSTSPGRCVKRRCISNPAIP